MIQTPETNNTITHAAGGTLAFLLSVIRCGEKLSPDEESHIQETIQKLDSLGASLTAFVNRIEQVHNDPRYRRVWELAQSHQGQYDGPQYETELNNLKAASVVEP